MKIELVSWRCALFMLPIWAFVALVLVGTAQVLVMERNHLKPVKPTETPTASQVVPGGAQVLPDRVPGPVGITGGSSGGGSSSGMATGPP